MSDTESCAPRESCPFPRSPIARVRDAWAPPGKLRPAQTGGSPVCHPNPSAARYNPSAARCNPSALDSTPAPLGSTPAPLVSSLAPPGSAPSTLDLALAPLASSQAPVELNTSDDWYKRRWKLVALGINVTQANNLFLRSGASQAPPTPSCQ